VKPHVHTPSQQVETWGVNGMKAHLEHDHPEVPLPMRWGVAELHQAHLKAHQAAQTPEEAPVADKHEHGDIARYHDQTDRRSVAYHLEDAHGLDPKDIDVREVYSQHASLHPMKACGAENPQYPGEYACEYPAGHGPIVDPEDGDMPITGTFDHGAPSKGVWWTGPPVVVSASKEQLAEISHVNQTEGERRVLEDRIICAMVGMDFDSRWAADSGISSAVRGAFRSTYGEAAKRLVTWLEHGGAMHLPPVASLEADLETAQKLQKAAESDRDKTAEDLARERTLVEDLEGVNNTLRQQLETAVVTRDRALEAGRLLEAQRDEVSCARDAALDERDEARRDAETARLQRDRARAVTREGRSALLTWIEEIKAQSPIPSDADYVDLGGQQVIDRITAILGETTAVTLAPEDCTTPHLGLARTGELLAELTSRIDLGHCGLEYRTVDTEEI
jgi:hypothetical protein